MLVQEQLLLAPWPDALLALPPFAAVRDGLGRLLFRGPRLRMGACEGRPRSITPDHAGRADYAGHAVNMAARYTEAAAHGGQVVCDVPLAEKALAAWRAAAAQQQAATAPSTIAEERSGGGCGGVGSGGGAGGGSPGSAADRVAPPEAAASHEKLEAAATAPPTAPAAAAGDPRIALAPHEVRALGADIIIAAAAAAGGGACPATTAELAATLRSLSGVSASRLDEIRALSGLSVRRLLAAVARAPSPPFL